jgi:hypothetical protein
MSARYNSAYGADISWAGPAPGLETAITMPVDAGAWAPQEFIIVRRLAI